MRGVAVAGGTGAGGSVLSSARLGHMNPNHLPITGRSRGPGLGAKWRDAYNWKAQYDSVKNKLLEEYRERHWPQREPRHV